MLLGWVGSAVIFVARYVCFIIYIYYIIFIRILYIFLFFSLFWLALAKMMRYNIINS